MPPRRTALALAACAVACRRPAPPPGGTDPAVPTTEIASEVIGDLGALVRDAEARREAWRKNPANRLHLEPSFAVLPQPRVLAGAKRVEVRLPVTHACATAPTVAVQVGKRAIRLAVSRTLPAAGACAQATVFKVTTRGVPRGEYRVFAPSPEGKSACPDDTPVDFNDGSGTPPCTSRPVTLLDQTVFVPGG